MALQMPVYRELTTIESKVFMGMSWRQCLAAVILAVAKIPLPQANWNEFWLCY